MEKLETYALAGAGAVGGAWKYYVRPELTARRAWLSLGVLIGAYELGCPPNELLSEGVDRALESHKAITTAAIGLTALHLCNALPERYDPISAGVRFLKHL